ERSEYEVDLSPGWNMISLPGQPTDPDINSVLSSESITSALAYVNGEWQVATRGPNGWEGTLMEIGANSALWIQSEAFTPIETLIPEREPGTLPPTIPVRQGWNLLPVIDVEQAGYGNDPGGVPTSATDYFSSISWAVAYAYDTQTNAWSRITPTAPQDVKVGFGYWVYALRDGELVP
ncbi:MAG: hypothetical protein WD533_00400, partial [Dehalococcoidia bacterium]